MEAASRRIKVWDLAVRVSHGLYPVLIGAAIASSERDEDAALHVSLGLALLGVVSFRLVWGLVGTRHARFAQFVRGPRATLEALRAMARGAPAHFVGHNPVGAVGVLVLLAAMLAAAGTGVALALREPGTDAGLVGRVHAASALVLPGLALLHVAGVLLSSALEGQNLVQGMVTGWKRAPVDLPVEPEPSRVVLVIGFALAALAGVGVVAAARACLPG